MPHDRAALLVQQHRRGRQHEPVLYRRPSTVRRARGNRFRSPPSLLRVLLLLPKELLHHVLTLRRQNARDDDRAVAQRRLVGRAQRDAGVAVVLRMRRCLIAAAKRRRVGHLRAGDPATVPERRDKESVDRRHLLQILKAFLLEHGSQLQC